MITFCFLTFLAKIAFAAPITLNSSKKTIAKRSGKCLSIYQIDNTPCSMNNRVLNFGPNEVEKYKEGKLKSSLEKLTLKAFVAWPNEKQWLKKNAQMLLAN